MKLIEKAFLLKRTPLFAGLDLDLVFAAADKLGTADYKAGQTIFEIGDEASRMYFIADGQIKASDNLLESPSFFGDEALFNERPRAYRAEALTHSTLLTLSKTNLMTIISEAPSVAIGLLQVRMP